MKNGLALLVLAFSNLLFSQKTGWLIEPPAADLPTKIEKGGTTVLPNGRTIQPLGLQIETAPHPFGLAVSSDGNWAATANSGIAPFSITLIEKPFSKRPRVRQIPDGPATDDGILEACFMGLAFSPDSKTLFVAGGQTGKIFLFDTKKGTKTGEIDCRTAGYEHSYLGDLVLSRDGKRLFVADQIGFRVAVIEVEKRAVAASVPTGRYPFGLALTPDERRLLVANVGQFEYKYFTDLDPKNPKKTAHDWPATSYGSREMIDGAPEKGIPPLGPVNADEAFSVWVFDLEADALLPKIRSKIKTGILVGQMVEDFPAVGGSSPNSLAATNKMAFVSNASNDCVSVIDLEKDTVAATISLRIDERLGQLKGAIPFGLTLSTDEKWLFVCESGLNSVVVVEVASKKTVGRLPVGWFPSKAKTSPDGSKILVSNAKGYGSGPNGGATFSLGAAGSYIGNLMRGTLSVIDLPKEKAAFEAFLKRGHEQVLASNFQFLETKKVEKTASPLPRFRGQKSCPIEHWVFISKENRTYDELFGQLENGAGEPDLARFGEKRRVENESGKTVFENVDVAPNHLALARRFGIADHFYCDSDVSADGHRWLNGTYPNEWCETSTAAAYGGRRSLKKDSKAPGNLAFYGSSGTIYPEDYNEAGSLWDHLGRHGVDFWNWGFGTEMAAGVADSTMKFAGEKYLVNYPLPAGLRERSSRLYPTYNMAIPDQFRADLFLKELDEKWLAKGQKLPQMMTILLPNDHTDDEREAAGYPFLESYVADNDLALGRIVERLSRTAEWKKMAIVVTEDDPQGGVDHVDAHRSILMVISPWAKRGHVSHWHYSFGSIFKTFWLALGLPCQNQYDAGALDLGDFFTEKPDFEPFSALPADARIFDPQKALDPFDEKFDWRAMEKSVPLDHVPAMKKDSEKQDLKKKKRAKKGE